MRAGVGRSHPVDADVDARSEALSHTLIVAERKYAEVILRLNPFPPYRKYVGSNMFMRSGGKEEGGGERREDFQWATYINRHGLSH